MDGMMGGMGLWMLLWALVALAVLGVAVLGIVALARHLSNPTRPGRQSQPVRDDVSQPKSQANP
jgi:hypothetical protein